MNFRPLFSIVIFITLSLTFHCALSEWPIKQDELGKLLDEASVISEDNLYKNFFSNKLYDKDNLWLSVGKGAYNKQYYSRDSFITFIGASKSERLRPTISHAIDWFSKYQSDDGYIPIWFRETEPTPNQFDLNIYYTAPYNLTPQNGAVRNIDHVIQFIHAILLDYEATGDKKKLSERLGNLEAAWKYLSTQTDNFLLTTKYSSSGGPDWADLIRRSGKNSFVNAYWYWVTTQLSTLYRDLGDESRSEFFRGYSQNIKSEFNNIFLVSTLPKNCQFGSTKHYASWLDAEGQLHDYFEIDSNSLAVASGLSDRATSLAILGYINHNFDYFVNSYGASRVLCGFYTEKDTSVPKGEYQNGAYWYIPSYFLALAEAKYSQIEYLNQLKFRSARASVLFKEEGLREWFYQDSKNGGQVNYSWSLAFPIFLKNLGSTPQLKTN